MDKLELSNKGAGAIGGAVGAAVGLVGGPVGSVAGAVLGSLVADTLKDVVSRMLSHRERIRVDNATVYISDGIKSNLAAGLSIRQDNFFEGDTNFSSNGTEILEGVLLKCKAQYQEKKVQLIANLFKNVAFNEAISPQAAYQLLNLADELTYFDLCIISYYGRIKELKHFNILPYMFHHFNEGTLGADNISAARDLLRLYQLGILRDADGSSFIEHTVIIPKSLCLDERGVTLFNSLELGQIDTGDVLVAMQPLEFKHHWAQSLVDYAEPYNSSA